MRYHATATSAAALAADTPVCWLMGASGVGGAKLRRLSAGVMTTSAIVPTSQQVTLAVNRVTSAGTTPTAGTASPLDPTAAASRLAFDTAFSVAPTLGTTDEFQITFNTLGSLDLGWEFLEEFTLGAGTTTGFAIVNRSLALPASHTLRVSLEWEE